jgi:hypothetical protein
MTDLLLTSPSRNPASPCRRARCTMAGANPSQSAAFRIETPSSTVRRSTERWRARARRAGLPGEGPSVRG